MLVRLRGEYIFLQNNFVTELSINQYLNICILTNKTQFHWRQKDIFSIWLSQCKKDKISFLKYNEVSLITSLKIIMKSRFLNTVVHTAFLYMFWKKIQFQAFIYQVLFKLTNFEKFWSQQFRVKLEWSKTKSKIKSASSWMSANQ